MVKDRTEYKATFNLLQKLIDRQKSEKVSNASFANRLGISTSLWNKTRTQTKEIGIALLSGVVKELPEYIPDVIIFLRSNHE